ncbi:MAG: VOC family protein [Gemmatimonadetes bacterium]|nr:VOC family protein [Gemmatimonadota bacterium]
MRASPLIAILPLLSFTAAAPRANPDFRPMTQIKRITPILFVEAIEPCLPFWVDRLGFEKTAEVPHGDRLGFVILARDGTELMIQTRASVAEDVPDLAGTPMKGTFLFIEVASADSIELALAGIEHVIPRRKTFYGADEIVVREPAGNTVIFAEFEKK